MKFIDLMDAAECLSEHIDDIKFEKDEDGFYLVVSCVDLSKVEDFIDENEANIGIIYMKRGKFKLLLT